MRRPISRLLALALAGLACVAASHAGVDAEPGGVRALLDRQVVDWNKKDLDAFMGGYWNSPEVVFQSGGDRSDGWEAMRDRYRKAYQGAGKEMGRLAFSGLEVVPLGADVALARGRWELTKSDGSKPGGLFTLILTRLPEGWRIVHDHTSIAAPK